MDNENDVSAPELAYDQVADLDASYVPENRNVPMNDMQRRFYEATKNDKEIHASYDALMKHKGITYSIRTSIFNGFRLQGYMKKTRN